MKTIQDYLAPLKRQVESLLIELPTKKNGSVLLSIQLAALLWNGKLETAARDAIPQGSVKDIVAATNSPSLVHEEYVATRRLTSSVWKEFQRKKIDHTWKAECIWCHKRLGGETKNGTKHLHVHLTTCAHRRSKKDTKHNHLKVTKDTDGTTISAERSNKGANHNDLNVKKDTDGPMISSDYSTFSQELSRVELARMIILHGYPLSIVEHYGFQRFVRVLQPLFKMVPSDGIMEDVISVYEMERMRTRELLCATQGRIAITADKWTSDDKNRSYIAVKAHFVDQSWILQSRLLRFLHVPRPHTAEVISETLSSCLSEWELEKRVSMVTLDNCCMDPTVMELLKQRLGTRHLLLDGSLLHMRCCAYMLNVVANNCMEVVSGVTDRIRASVEFWTSTTENEEMFLKVACGLNVNTSQKLALDCSTRWNSAMLSDALSYRPVFDHLQQKVKHFACAPSDEDWKLVKAVCARLKLFCEIEDMISGPKHVTANTYFPKIYGIRIAMRKWDLCENEVIEKMTEKIVEEVDRYCSEVHYLMAVATVLDPRYKLELLQFYFPSLFGDEAYNEINRIRQLCYDLVRQYQGNRSEVLQSCVREEEDLDQLSSYDLYIACKFSKGDARSELDNYLDEPVIPQTVDFDVLDWWKTLGTRCPTLQMIARDILAVPVSGVISQSALSNTGRVLSPQHRKLSPMTLEALMCSQDWLRAEKRDAGSSGLFSYFTCLEDADAMEAMQG
ncbi:hypothetical protein ACP4OV_016073 [Aristida adscensionis]